MHTEHDEAVELGEAIGQRLELLPTLVAMVQAEPASGRLLTLLNAVEHAVGCDDRTDAELVGLAYAAAQLSLMLGNEPDAARWAHRGLRLDPHHAGLAIIVGWLPDDINLGDPAVTILRRVAQRHPGYRDVRSALERRAHQLACH